MAVDRYTWKKGEKPIEEQVRRVRTESKKAEIKKELRDGFMRGMIGKKTGKPEKGKIPEKPITPREVAKSKDGAKKAPDAKPQDKARVKAESKFVEFKGERKTYEKTILKVPETVKEEPKLKTKVQGDAQPKESAKKGAARTAGEAAVIVSKQAKPAEKGAKQKAGAVVKRGKKPAVKGSKKTVAKRDAKGAKAGAQTAQGKLKPASEGAKHVLAQAGVAAGAQAKVRGKGAEGDKGKKKITSDKDEKGKTVGKRQAYTGSGEAQQITAGLGNLLGGDAGDESPFDLEPRETAVTEIKSYEPMDETRLGTELYSNIVKYADAEKVRLKAKLSEKEIEKRLVEKPNYENWDLSQEPLEE